MQYNLYMWVLLLNALKCLKMSFWHLKFFLLILSLCFDIIIIITIYLWNVNLFHAMIGLDVSPMNEILYTFLKVYFSFMRQPEQSQVIFHTISTSLPAPVHTFHPCHHHITIQADIQLSTPQCSKCPNHIILPRLTTLATLWTPIESTLRLLSSNDTPHIHLTIYLFATHNQQWNLTSCKTWIQYRLKKTLM